MSEPYKPPSNKEVKHSGTADWVQEALDKHEKKQQKLAQVFGATEDKLRDDKGKLAEMWHEPSAEEVDRGPDLFADERSKAAREKQKLASVWDQDRLDREAEEEQLRGLFGATGNSNSSKNKKRR